MTAPAIAPITRPRPRIAPPPRPISHVDIPVPPEKRPGYCKVSDLDYCLEPVVEPAAIQWCAELHRLVKEWFSQDCETWDVGVMRAVHDHMTTCPECIKTGDDIDYLRSHEEECNVNQPASIAER